MTIVEHIFHACFVSIDFLKNDLTTKKFVLLLQ